MRDPDGRMERVGDVQGYPTRTVTLVVPFAAGGPTDVVARTLGAAMSKSLGQAVVIENRLGAGGTIAANYRQGNPDSCDLHPPQRHGNGSQPVPQAAVQSAHRFRVHRAGGRRPHDAHRAQGLSRLQPEGSWRTCAPTRREINLANAGLGAVSAPMRHLLQQALGVELTTAPFSGTAPALTALLGGQVDVLCDQTTQTIPHQGRQGALLRRHHAHAHRGAPRWADARRAGPDGFEVVVWHGVYARRERLARRSTSSMPSCAALRDPDVAARLAELGGQIVPESKQTPAGLQRVAQGGDRQVATGDPKAGVYAD